MSREMHSGVAAEHRVYAPVRHREAPEPQGVPDWAGIGGCRLVLQRFAQFGISLLYSLNSRVFSIAITA